MVRSGYALPPTPTKLCESGCSPVEFEESLGDVNCQPSIQQNSILNLEDSYYNIMNQPHHDVHDKMTPVFFEFPQDLK